MAATPLIVRCNITMGQGSGKKPLEGVILEHYPFTWNRVAKESLKAHSPLEGHPIMLSPNDNMMGVAGLREWAGAARTGLLDLEPLEMKAL